MGKDDKAKTQLTQELENMRRSLEQQSQENSQNKKLIEKYCRDMEHFRLIAESAADAIWTLDSQMQPTYISPSIKQLLGYSAEEALLLKMEDIFTPQSCKNMLHVLAQEVNRGLAGEENMRPVLDMDLQMRHKDGSILSVEVKYNLLRRPGAEDIEAMGILRNISKRRKQAEDLLGDANQMVAILESTVSALSILGEAKDPYTAGHQRRVANIALRIARALNLPEHKAKGIRLAGLVHDIGKVHIPSEVLGNLSQLSDAEWTIIKMHPTTGYTLLKTIRSPWPLAETVFQHHERINGSGYPRRMTRHNILTEAKILAVADVFEAMLAQRPYRPALNLEMVIQELKQNRGVLYDTDAVDACLKLAETDNYFLEQSSTDLVL